MIELLDNPETDGLDGRHGAYTHTYARERLGNHRLRNAIETGELMGFGRGVLMDAGRVLDLRTRSAAALLLTDGLLVGPTAAALHGCTAVGGFPVHVRIPYTQRARSRPGLIVHQGDLNTRDMTDLDGLRVLKVDLAITEVLCTAPHRAALACTDEILHAMRPDDRAPFVAAVREHLNTRPDRRGTRRAAALLAMATGRPENPAQSACLLVLREAGFPPPVPQYEVGRRRVDFAWPEQQVALEFSMSKEEEPHHANDPQQQGWIVIEADHQDLTDPTMLCSRLRVALRTRTRIAA